MSGGRERESGDSFLLPNYAKSPSTLHICKTTSEQSKRACDFEASTILNNRLFSI